MSSSSPNAKPKSCLSSGCTAAAPPSSPTFSRPTRPSRATRSPRCRRSSRTRVSTCSASSHPTTRLGGPGFLPLSARASHRGRGPAGARGAARGRVGPPLAERRAMRPREVALEHPADALPAGALPGRLLSRHPPPPDLHGLRDARVGPAARRQELARERRRRRFRRALVSRARDTPGRFGAFAPGACRPPRAAGRSLRKPSSTPSARTSTCQLSRYRRARCPRRSIASTARSGCARPRR